MYGIRYDKTSSMMRRSEGIRVEGKSNQVLDKREEEEGFHNRIEETKKIQVNEF